MKKIYLFIYIAFLTSNTIFGQVTISGGSAAINGTYTNLTNISAVTGAFAAINAGGSQAGNNILITISADIVETGAASLNAGNWTTLTINPTGGVPRLVSGSVSGNLINLAGADNVTIDGLNSGGNALTISNTYGSPSTATTLRFVNDANNNTIIRCNLLGSSTAFATVYFATASVTGNDNNTITQCNISASASGTPRYAIQSSGSLGFDNSSNTISNNSISDFFNASSASGGIYIASNNSDWTITNNRLYQTATRIATSGITYYGIIILSGGGYTISNNIIGFANAAGTGTTNMIGLTSGTLGGTFPGAFTPGTGVPNGTRYIAINCAFTVGGTVSSIQNNTIAGIALYTTGAGATTVGLLCGIAVISGNADIGTVTGNTIGSSTGTSSIYAATALVAGVISGIYCSSTNTVNIQNNIMGGIDVSGTTATEATGFKGIEVIGTGTFTISNNTIGNATANNIRTGYLLTGANLSNTATTPTAASGAANVRAIVSQASGASLTISNNIMQGFQSSGTGSLYRAISNSGLVTGTFDITNNQIGTGSTGAVNFIAATGGGIHGIYNNGAASTSTINITGNTIQGISLVSSGVLSGIENTAFADSDVAINISNNQFGTATGNFFTYSAATSNPISAIVNAGGTTNCVLTIQNNSIRGIMHAVAATSIHTYIQHTATGIAAVNILGNTFINLSVNTAGNVTFIADAGGLSATGTSSCSNNAIVTAFNKTAPGGNLYCFYSTGNSVNGATITQTGNNFSNITVTGGTIVYCWYNLDGTSSSSGPAKTITGNTFSNINGGTASVYGIFMDRAAATICSGNTLSNFTGNGLLFGIYLGTTSGQSTHSISSNTISSFVSTGTGGDVAGILGGSLFVPVMNINGNTVTGLSTTKSNGNIAGIEIDNAVGAYVYDNLVTNISGSGAVTPLINGIAVFSGATVDIHGNRIHTLTQSGAVSTASPVINGMLITAGTTVTAYNNFIANLTAPNANLADAIRGISVNSSTASTATNLYYNSIYLNASSAGSNFGTSGIYHLTNAIATTGALTMIDNIIVNTSTANGTGFTAAYRRSDATLNNFATASDHNLFYADTPSPNRLIYYDGTNSDQTITAYKIRVSSRDANSLSLMPTFVSATDLHLTAANCQLDGRGTPIAISFDFDLESRNPTYPDIGADEFSAPGSSTLPATSACEDRIVTPVTGTIYTNNACGPIARVVPSGADPVSGIVNVCVTLDATQQYFNGEPYVQRHFDIEPVTSNQTTTSATITLYITNQEFVDYNTNNPAWPGMPTSVNGNADPNRFNVKITQFHGAATTSPSSPGNYPGVRVLILPTNVLWNGSYWEVTFNVSGFSGFYVHTNNFNAPLPVVVNYLTGRKQGSNHLLNWKVTCNSTPRATMTLERSNDNRNFTGIHTITADAARCNQPFNYTDADPMKGMNYYRLKIVDADGKITYSTIVALLNAVKGFDITSIAPNPVVADNFKLNIASAQSSKIELVIFDMQGRLVNRQTLSLIAGFNSLPVHVANLSPGTYTIQGSIADDRSKVIRFVKQ